MRICSLSVPRLKDEWNQTDWSVKNLRCGTAGGTDHGEQYFDADVGLPEFDREYELHDAVSLEGKKERAAARLRTDPLPPASRAAVPLT